MSFFAFLASEKHDFVCLTVCVVPYAIFAIFLQSMQKMRQAINAHCSPNTGPRSKLITFSGSPRCAESFEWCLKAIQALFAIYATLCKKYAQISPGTNAPSY